MTTTPPQWWTQTQNLTRLDRRPLRPLPSGRRIALAGLLSIVGSLIADVILSALGKAVLNPPAYFGKFNFSAYASLTILGVVGATVGWAVLVRVSSQPRWFVLRAAVAVTVVLLIPDFMILPNNPAAPVIVLMVEHVLIAVVTTYALLKVAPAGRPSAVGPTRASQGDGVPAGVGSR